MPHWHIMITLRIIPCGERFTTVKDRKKKIGTGLWHAMLKQLGLTRHDIER